MAAEVQAEIYWTLQIKVGKKEGKQSTIQWLLAQVLNTNDSPSRLFLLCGITINTSDLIAQYVVTVMHIEI